MKKFNIILCIILFSFIMTACEIDVESVNNVASKNEEESLTFVSKFYDNFGDQWMSVEGKTFSISPNKVKEYYYDSSGSWISGYTLSSVMTINIDDNFIESCGSTIVFADNRLKEYDIKFDNEIITEDALENDKNSKISNPTDLTVSDYIDIQWWWQTTKQVKGYQGTPKIVVVQSQLGNPICMYIGDSVSWDIPKNLPKTTKLMIDDKALFIHRANFAIIDTSLFD